MNYQARMVALIVFGVFFFWGGLAAAETDQEAEARAQEAFESGAQFYYEDNFGRAIVEFRKAHQAYPHPMFLHNIALANQRLGRVDRALDAASEADEMEEELPPESESRNRGIIAGATGVLTGRSVADEVARRIESEQEVEEEEEVIAGPPVTEESSGFGGLGWAGVGSLVVGAGALGGAAFIDSQITSFTDEPPTDEDEFDARKAELLGQQPIGKAMLFSGIGLSTVGVALIAMELVSGSSDQPVAFSPTLDRPGVEVLFRW